MKTVKWITVLCLTIFVAAATVTVYAQETTEPLAVSAPAQQAVEAAVPVLQSRPSNARSGVSAPPEQRRQIKARRGGSGAPETPLTTRVFKLQHSRAEEVGFLLRDIKLSNNVKYVPDTRTNVLIVVSPDKYYKQIEELIETLDVPQDPKSASTGMSGMGMMGGMGGMGMGMGGMGMGGMGMGGGQYGYDGMGDGMGNPLGMMNRPRIAPTNVAYRIYAVETPIEFPAGQSVLKPFSLSLTCNTEEKLFIDIDSLTVEGLSFYVTEVEERTNESKHTTYFRISGRTASMENIKKMIEIIEEKFGSKCVLQNLRMEPVSHPEMNNAALKMHVQLPGNVSTTVEKLLNNEIRTAGYWFGNSALPGDCLAPIGPWKLEMNSTPNPDSSFLLNIELKEEDSTILSNSVNAKIDQPIIIGYTRIQNDVLCPGALVIIPQKEFE